MTLRADTDAALASERASYDVEISTLRAENESLNSQIASLKDDIVLLSGDLSAANSQIAMLRLQLAECEGATGIPVITPSDDIHAAVAAATGAVRLEGTFTLDRPLAVPDGLTVVGPATIVTNALDGLVLGEGVTVRDLDISGATRHGINLALGATVTNCHLHHNEKDGAGGDLKGRIGNPVTMVGCEIDHNGSDYWLGKGAAGVKMFHTYAFAMDDCYVHDNIGNGVWGDAHCGDFDVLNSVIEGNTRKGVFYEKCGEADGSWGSRTWAVYTGALYVWACTIRDNDTEGKPQANAGVSIISSKNAGVVDCTFGGNERAITVRDDPTRLTDDKHGWVPENIAITGNTLNGSVVVGCDLPGVTCSNNS